MPFQPPRRANAVIRLLEKHEVAAYREIRREALTTDPDAFGETLEGFDGRTEEELRSWLEAHAGPGERGILVAELGGRPVAMCGYAIRDADGGEGSIWGMFVSRKARRQGIGQRLLSDAKGLLEKHGARTITARVAAPNEGAIDFYRAAGFTIGGRKGTLREGSDVPVYEIESPVR